MIEGLKKDMGECWKRGAKVNWLRSSVVNVGFADIMNGCLDGVSLDALHAIWIWRAQLERVGGAAVMGAQETQRVLRRSSSGS
ncbi:unnamed protein product [Sphagnum jensenii]|uniref:Uncharacterized protein n=1 Tax=Sphagnum jensenii TaxID=128206 RepID=A0ABP1BAN4_9BRYO